MRWAYNNMYNLDRQKEKRGGGKIGLGKLYGQRHLNTKKLGESASNSTLRGVGNLTGTKNRKRYRYVSLRPYYERAVNAMQWSLE